MTKSEQEIPEQETGFAKINLALHVRGRMAADYHAIETLFAFVDDGDRLVADHAEALSLAIEGPFSAKLDGDVDDNLVLRAARAMAESFAPGRGAALTLDKRLPVASGIGGGSADAAAAIRLLDRLWGLDRPLAHYEPLAAGLGADVPACLHSRSAIGRGTGIALDFVDVPGLSDQHILLANPGVPVTTADIFRRWDGSDSGALPARRWDGKDGGALPASDLDALFAEARNDLEPPAIALVPAIGTLLAAMREESERVRMSGSGATCFALYDSHHDAVTSADAMRARFPAIWTMTGRMRRSACTAASAGPQTMAS